MINRASRIRILGFLLIVFGLVLFLKSFTGITGFVTLGEIDKRVGYFLGAVFAAVGLFLALVRSSEERRYHAARRKLAELLDGKDVKPESSFNLLTRYDLVRYEGKKMKIKGRSYPVYVGHLKDEYGGGTEEFTVDRAEEFEMRLPRGIRRRMPSHIDVQRGRSYHERVNIPWRDFLHKNEDVLAQHGTNSDEVLSGLEHRNKRKGRKAA